MAFLKSREYNLTNRVTIKDMFIGNPGGFSDIYVGTLIDQPRADSWFGTIKKWTLPNRSQLVAVKVMRAGSHMTLQTRNKIQKKLADEATIWHGLDHSNILPLLGYIEGVSGSMFPSLVSPWCDSNTIAHYLKDEKPRISDHISLLLQVISAVSYLHTCKPPITHGDLKPDNFFLQSNYQVRLSDFGLSKVPRDDTGSRFSTSTDHVGTLRFMSSEFFVRTKGTKHRIPPRSPPSDIWTLAWTFYVILTGSYPYSEDSNCWDVIEQIKMHELPAQPHDAPTDLAQLQSTIWPIMMDCWEANPFRRPEAEKVARQLREAILLEHSSHFDGPMFHSQTPDEPRPSVVGDEDAFFLEHQGKGLKELNPDTARGILAASALEYLCRGQKLDAYSVQIHIGWILIDQGRFSAAQAHFAAAQRALDVANPLLVRCKQGLARAAQGLQNFDESIQEYNSALILCRARGFADFEYIIVRERGEAILDHPKNVDPAQNLISLGEARRHFTEALAFATAQEKLEYQARVRCDLVQLEQRAGNEETARNHAIAAFQCAQETGQHSLAEDVYGHLVDTNILPEALRNALYAELQAMPQDEGLDLDSQVSSLIMVTV